MRCEDGGTAALDCEAGGGSDSAAAAVAVAAGSFSGSLNCVSWVLGSGTIAVAGERSTKVLWVWLARGVVGSTVTSLPGSVNASDFARTSVCPVAAARIEESGVSDASGVSNCESPSTEAASMDTRGLRPRFFKTGFGGEGALAPASVGEKTCVGSSDSVARVVRRRVVGLGVVDSLDAAALRGRPRPLPVLSGAGAGVNSSSSSSWSSGVGVLFSSPSESSVTGAFRFIAAERVDLRGDAEGILTVTVGLVRRRGPVCYSFAGEMVVRSSSHVVSVTHGQTIDALKRALTPRQQPTVTWLAHCTATAQLTRMTRLMQ